MPNLGRTCVGAPDQAGWEEPEVTAGEEGEGQVRAQGQGQGEGGHADQDHSHGTSKIKAVTLAEAAELAADTLAVATHRATAEQRRIILAVLGD